MMLRMGVPVATPLAWGDIACAVRAWWAGCDEVDAASAFQEIFGNAGVAFAGSGRIALFAALEAIKERSGREEVIVPAFVCPSVPRAVVKAGLRVVLCDVNAAGFGLDEAALERLIGNRTLAVVTTHLYGYPRELSGIMTQARSQGAIVIEDAAQCFGAAVAGETAGLRGDVGIFSFGMSKVLWALGAGIVVSRDTELAKRVRDVSSKFTVSGRSAQAAAIAKMSVVNMLLRSHHLGPIAKVWASGFRGRGDADDFIARRSSAPQIRLAARLASRIGDITAVRRRNAERLLSGLQGLSGIRLPTPAPDSSPVFLRFPVIVEDLQVKRQLVDALQNGGINVSEMYDRPNLDLVRAFGESSQHWPVTEYLADRMLNLPTHCHIRERDLQVMLSVFYRILGPGKKTYEWCA